MQSKKHTANKNENKNVPHLKSSLTRTSNRGVHKHNNTKVTQHSYHLRVDDVDAEMHSRYLLCAQHVMMFVKRGTGVLPLTLV